VLKKVINEGYMLTLKVHGHVYGSVLPVFERKAQFLQIYFIGDDNAEVDLKSKDHPGVKDDLVKSLQLMKPQHKFFKVFE